LVSSAADDTQLAVNALIASLPEPTVWAKPATSSPAREVSSSSLLSSPGFLVVNDLFAGQYLRALSLHGQTPVMRNRSAAYDILMKRPALLISSTAGNFAYRNVPYRLIPLGGDPRLLEEAAKQAPPGPDIALQFVPGQTDAAPSGP
jgi:hypothetical protein